jgi:hypothetical protein
MGRGAALAAGGLMAMASAAVPGPAVAQVGFFLTSPGITLSEDDRLLLGGALRGLLDEGGIDEARPWRNDDTGTAGMVRLTGREAIDEVACGRVDIVLEQGDRRRGFDLLFCRRPDGTWGIAG